MMYQLGKYIVSLIVTALLSGILIALFPDGTTPKILRMVCGIMLCLCVLNPLTQFTVPQYDDIFSDYLEEGTQAAEQGAKIAQYERDELIKYGLETYVLEKASVLGADITANVQLDMDGNPIHITVNGTASNTIQKELKQMISNDLGIPEEDQQWSGTTG